MPQAVVSDRPEVLLCLAPFAHPLCNFAIVWEPAGLGLALQAAEGRPHFCIYSFERAWMPPTLALAHEMVVMRGLGTPAFEPLAPVQTPRDRLTVTRFMCSQFFDTQSGEVRERLAEATARVRDLELFAFGEPRMLAAGMMYEGERAIGLYNICVDGKNRRRGWGASVVHQLLSECARRDKPAVLQCSSDLAAWYSKLGFKSTGKLFTWSIPGN